VPCALCHERSPFGLVASVYNYNRRAALLNRWLRVLGLHSHHYYDDKFGFGVRAVVEWDLKLVATLHHVLGIDFSFDKVQRGTQLTILGVEYNFESGELGVCPGRRDDLLAELDSVMRGDGLAPGPAGKLKGKLQFLASHYTGRYGRSFLKAFSDRQYGAQGPASDSAIRRAAAFWRYLLRSDAPARRLWGEDEDRVDGLLFTDGYAPDHHREAHPDLTHRAGWVFFDLRSGEVCFGSYEPCEATMAHWCPRKHQVAMIEMVAPVVAMHALAARVQDTQLLVFIDSEAVEGALVKGYSPQPDLGNLAGAFWAYSVKNSVAPYIERIPTDANPADDPSRGKYQFLLGMGAVRLESLPPAWLREGTLWEATLGGSHDFAPHTTTTP
jgi:hypothetical protein